MSVVMFSLHIFSNWHYSIIRHKNRERKQIERGSSNFGILKIDYVLQALVFPLFS